MSQCLIGPGCGLIVLRVDGFCTAPDVLAGVIPVEDSVGICKGLLVNRPAPVGPVSGKNLLLGLAITTPARQSKQRRTKRLKVLALSPDHTLVPAVSIILPIDTAHPHLFPDQAVFFRVLWIRFALIGAVH